MRQAPLRMLSGAMILGLCVVWGTSCTTAVRQGRGSSYLIIDALTAASGAKPNEFSATLQSDVITAGTVYQDSGTVTLRLGMKNPTSPVDPTTNNEITVTSYHVSFSRADGRNTPGVDVPYAFDGAITGTVKLSTSLSVAFPLVRAQAKLEAPLLALRGQGGALLISTFAQVTFYGHDQSGNEVSVTGTISVNFADWGDPA